MTDEGHVCRPGEPRIVNCRYLPAIRREIVVKAAAQIAADRRIVTADLSSDPEHFRENCKAFLINSTALPTCSLISDLAACLCDLAGDKIIICGCGKSAKEVWERRYQQDQLCE
jgi:hypothetical protein